MHGSDHFNAHTPTTKREVLLNAEVEVAHQVQVASPDCRATFRPLTEGERVLLGQRIQYVLARYQERTADEPQPIPLERTREVLAEIIAEPVDTE
jgi:hypothetical protein